MSLSPHPFLQQPSPFSASFPPQLIPFKDKDPDWQKACMNALEGLGKNSFWRNIKIQENYRMKNGEFLKYQYQEVDDNEYMTLIQQAQQHLQRKLGMHHFDFISEICNTLLGELQGHPDTHKAKAVGEEVDNARVREKSRLLKEFVDQQIEKEIQAALVNQGFELDKTDFGSEQEATDYNSQLQKARQALTPAEIQSYMTTNWQHVAEKWANITLDASRKRFELPKKELIEFEDMLASDTCFRHFFLNGNGFSQETWNPLHVFYGLGPDQTDVEKGDYVGQVHYLSLAQVIDKYGHLLTGDQLNELYGKIKPGSKGYEKDWFGNKISYTSVEGNPYGVRIPWNNPWFNNLPQVKDAQNGLGNSVLFNPTQATNLFQHISIGPTYQITEGYWKSQKKVGRLTWVNPETGELEKVIVDETIVLPLGTKVIEGNVSSELSTEAYAGPTVEWTWINEIWGGIKISPMGSGSVGIEQKQDPLYLNVKPLAFQGKPDAFLYEAELPVVGSIFNARNATSQSLIDRIKPFQVAYNLFLNQAYYMAEDEIMPFLLMDVNAIPKLKDWGGKEGFEKWMSALKDLHMGPLDTRPGVVNGANTGGQLPAVINLDITQRMITRFDLAMRFKQMALDQIGLSPQRLSDVKPGETATGVNTAVQRSYVQTATLFSRFYDYVQRTLKKTLDFAQFTQATDRDILASTIYSDYTNGFITLNGTELLLTQLQVFVSNAQQDQRDLEISRQLALENNTSDISANDRQIMATSSSLQKIREVLENSALKSEQNQQAGQQLEQQKLQAAQQMQEADQQWKSEEAEKDRQARKEEAYIKTFGFGSGAVGDANDNGTADAFEFARLSQTSQGLSQKAQADQQKNQLNQQKLLVDQKKHQDSLLEADKERKSRENLAKMKISQAKIAGDKSK